MTIQDPQFTHALNAWLNQHTGKVRGVSIVQLAGRRCVIKFAGSSKISGTMSYALRYLRASLISALCWVGFRELPSARVLLRNSLDDETKRILVLHASKYPAPEILHDQPGVLVLGFAGENLPTILRQSSPEERILWMDRAARDLATLHRAGFVHGGAQLRNLVVSGEQITRIDYEENIGEALSKSLGQAYDVYQMMSSMAGLSGKQFSEAERRLLCRRLLISYLNENPDLDVKAQLERFAEIFTRIQKHLGWLLRHLPGRDVRGFLYVTDALRL
jgi:tRNA A-37 threonylcarbamoyl transferase component Bud32